MDNKLDEPILIRLINNDKVIGQILSLDKDVIAIYAPMLVKSDEDGNLSFSKYESLSDTIMAIFEHRFVLMLTRPKESIVEFYDTWHKENYPSLDDLIKEIKLKNSNKNFDVNLINNLFAEFSKNNNKLN